ncbi:hypothetical protein D9M70_433330 [compost metagenome]
MEVLDAAAVGDIGDTSLDGGHPAIDDRHRVVGGLQLRTIHRIGAGIAQHTGGDVGDLLRPCAAMLGTERADTGIPQQRISGQTGDLIADGDDVALDIGHSAVDGGHLAAQVGHAVIDSGHRIVGGLQLATVDRFRAGIAQLAGGDVGDLVRAISTMQGTERTGSGIPQQRITFQAHDPVVDVGDTTAKGGHTVIDVSDIALNAGHPPIDARHRFIGGIQLTAIHCIGAGFAQGGGGDIDDFSFVSNATNRNDIRFACN